MEHMQLTGQLILQKTVRRRRLYEPGLEVADVRQAFNEAMSLTGGQIEWGRHVAPLSEDAEERIDGDFGVLFANTLGDLDYTSGQLLSEQKVNHMFVVTQNSSGVRSAEEMANGVIAIPSKLMKSGGGILFAPEGSLENRPISIYTLERLQRDVETVSTTLRNLLLNKWPIME